MLSLGIMDKVAMARGGWSTDVTMKQIYQHVFASDRAAAGGKVNTFFETIAPGIVPGGDVYKRQHQGKQAPGLQRKPGVLCRISV